LSVRRIIFHCSVQELESGGHVLKALPLTAMLLVAGDGGGAYAAEGPGTASNVAMVSAAAENDATAVAAEIVGVAAAATTAAEATATNVGMGEIETGSVGKPKTGHIGCGGGDDESDFDASKRLLLFTGDDGGHVRCVR
jgi:hypothetical protein